MIVEPAAVVFVTGTVHLHHHRIRHFERVIYVVLCGSVSKIPTNLACPPRWALPTVLGIQFFEDFVGVFRGLVVRKVSGVRVWRVEPQSPAVHVDEGVWRERLGDFFQLDRLHLAERPRASVVLGGGLSRSPPRVPVAVEVDVMRVFSLAEVGRVFESLAARDVYYRNDQQAHVPTTHTATLAQALSQPEAHLRRNHFVRMLVEKHQNLHSTRTTDTDTSGTTCSIHSHLGNDIVALWVRHRHPRALAG
mmetsp:Transcript_28929/g.50883  ORF Transcript_28929/g.50883 Transcript_28929/m.50883 type:complete len:249 (+) Transcript_28929:473-1219(+)